MKRIIPAVLGVLATIGIAVGSFYVGEKDANAHDEEASAAILRAESSIQDNTMHALESWRTQAVACQARFDTVTILVEPRPVQSAASIPLLHGLFSLSLNSAGGALGGNDNGMQNVWAIPAEVRPQTTLPGAVYRWIDAKTGELKGTFPAAYPGQQNITVGQ